MNKKCSSFFFWDSALCGPGFHGLISIELHLQLNGVRSWLLPMVCGTLRVRNKFSDLRVKGPEFLTKVLAPKRYVSARWAVLADRDEWVISNWGYNL